MMRARGNKRRFNAIKLREILIKSKFVIPAKAGIQEQPLRRNAPPFFDLPPFGREKTNWIPAFAGMTEF
jgi:hypothetical protein